MIHADSLALFERAALADGVPYPRATSVRRLCSQLDNEERADAVIDVPTRIREQYPSLADWLAQAEDEHPLAALLDDDDPGAQVILRVFDTIIARIVAADPLRWRSKRGDFRRCRNAVDLRSVYAELMLASLAAHAGLAFEFGATGGAPQPDLIFPDHNVAIEIKSRALDSMKTIEEAVEAALPHDAAHTVRLIYEEHPLRVRAEERERIAEEVRRIVDDDNVNEGKIDVCLDGTQEDRAVHLEVEVDSVRGKARPKVTSSVRGSLLDHHLEQAECEIVRVLTDEQKLQQAKSMPTILAVDMSHVGVAYMRPPGAWASHLTALLSSTDGQCPGIDTSVTPWAGVAVFMADYGRVEPEIAWTATPGTPAEQQAAVSAVLDAMTRAASHEASMRI